KIKESDDQRESHRHLDGPSTFDEDEKLVDDGRDNKNVQRPDPRQMWYCNEFKHRTTPERSGRSRPRAPAPGARRVPGRYVRRSGLMRQSLRLSPSYVLQWSQKRSAG